MQTRHSVTSHATASAPRSTTHSSGWVPYLRTAAVACAVLGMLGCATQNGGNTSSDKTTSNAASNSTATATTSDNTQNTSDAKQQLPVTPCATSKGALYISVDEQSDWYGKIKATGLGSPQSVLQAMVEESQCFTVVPTAQPNAYTLAPTASINQEAASPISIGIGGTIGNFIGIGLRTALRSTEARSTLTLTPPQTQLATGNAVQTATGSSSKTDLGLFTGVSGSAGAVSINGISVGGYLSSKEGKLVTAAFVDAYNKLVAPTTVDSVDNTKDDDAAS